MYLNDQMIDSGALARRLLAPANNLVPVNLLTRQQASLEDAGTTDWLVSANCTIARSTAQAFAGSGSLEVTSTAAATATVRLPNGVSAVRVLPSRPYTAIAHARAAVTARAASVYVNWYDAAGSSISLTAIVDVATSTSAWTRLQSTAVSPSNAAYATVLARFSGAAGAGEVHYFDGFGLWEGAGGSWVNGGERLDPSTLGWYWDESVGRRLFVWDTINSRWQMVYGDTGWRDVSPENSWTASALRVRRFNNVVSVIASAVNGGSASGDTFYTLPSGFRPYVSTRQAGVTNGGAFVQISAGVIGAGQLNTSRSGLGASTIQTTLTLDTADTWPTVLPGSASGSIPSA